MKIIKLGLILLTSILLTDCFGNLGNNQIPQGVSAPALPAAAPINDARARSIDDGYKKERKNSYARSKKKYSGPVCADEDRQHSCKTTCRRIFKSRDRDYCEDLAIEQIDRLNDIDKILRNPRDRQLDEITADDFQVYIYTSITAIDRHIRSYGAREAGTLLAWSLISETFYLMDDGTTIPKLLGRLGNDVETIFTKDVRFDRDTYDNLFELIEQYGQNYDFVHDYIDNECQNSSNHNTIKNLYKGPTTDAAGITANEKLQCFKLYCDIGKRLGSSNYRSGRNSRGFDANDWLHSDSVLDDRLDNYIRDRVNALGITAADVRKAIGINANSGLTQDELSTDDSTALKFTGNTNGWDSTKIQDLGDVQNWEQDLCLGL